ncbi:MAG: O-antigen ligase family protein [Thermoleophilia bacterium]|nr:O-antigen ligase family protein [Thermoleophilia bacterium]
MKPFVHIGSVIVAGARRVYGVGLRFLPHGGLAAIWLWLMFSSGGYMPRTWLLPAAAMGLLALLCSASRIYPGKPGQLSAALIALFMCYALWVAASVSWASSLHRVWLETARVFFLVLVFWTACLCFKDAPGQKAFRYLLLVASTVIFAVCLVALWTSGSASYVFAEGRFVFPVGDADSVAALLVVPFWPLLWLSAGPEERAPVRGLALGIATGLLGLAVLTRSEGAAWSLACSAIFAFAVSPGRLRMLLHIFPIGLVITYGFPTLHKYWSLRSGGSLSSAQDVLMTGGQGGRVLLTAAVVASFCGMILALLEHWIKVTARMKTIFGILVLVALLAGGCYVALTKTRDSGGPVRWLEQKVETLTAKTAPASPELGATERTNPWLAQSTSQERLALWKDAVSIFREAAVLGVGAGNFGLAYDRVDLSPGTETDSPHSLVLQLFVETGIIGGILFLIPLVVASVGVLWPRVAAARSESPPEAREKAAQPTKSRWGNHPLECGWPVALLCGTVYWFVHASLDSLWPVTAVTIPPVLFIAGAVTRVDLHAGLLWPRARKLFAGVPHWANGLLARVFRGGIAVLACLALLGASLPYAGIRWEDIALATHQVEAGKALKRASMACWLQPLSPQPLLAKAMIYEDQARRALTSDYGDKAGAVLDNLSLAISSYAEGASLEPSNWLCSYEAGIATLNLALARAYLEHTLIPPLTTVGNTPAPLATDWTLLAQADAAPPAGNAALSLATTPSEVSLASLYRNLSLSTLLDQAESWLHTALYLRPAAYQARQALDFLRGIRRALQ